MWSRTSRFATALATVLLCSGLGVGGRAAADSIIDTPAGLSAGDTFRIVFVTDGFTDATSSDISDYNAFVTADASTEAGGGAFTYNGVAVTWSVIGSTPTTSAIDNVGETGSPVYLASGTLVTGSDTASGLWSGLLNSPINQDLQGNGFAPAAIWTGTTTDGASSLLNPLSSPNAGLGFTNQSGPGWVMGGAFPSDNGFQLYGISQELIVPGAVPEPSTLWMAVTGICAGCAFGWSRGRRAPRRSRPFVGPVAPWIGR